MAKKRAVRGTGSVFEDKARNRYRGKVTIDGQVHTVYDRTKTGARAKLNALLKSGGETTTPKASSYTVETAVNEWLERDLAGRNRAPQTVELHRWAADRINAEIGKKPAAKLTVRKADDLLDQLAADGLSRSSLLKIRGTLSQALQFAVKRGDLSRNVAKDATIPPSATRAGERTSLSPTEARTLLDVLQGERNGLMLALSLRLGLRPGEAAGLFWTDVGNEAVNVTRGVRMVKNRAAVSDDLKTAAAKRTIELPPGLDAWFEDHRQAQRLERMAATSWVDDRLVFTSPTGNVLSPPNVRKQLANVCRRAEVPVIRPNELRHSCASLLADEGVPNELIADLLGHTTTRMVDETYRHRLRPVVSVAANATWAAGA